MTFVGQLLHEACDPGSLETYGNWPYDVRPPLVQLMLACVHVHVDLYM